MDSSTFLSRLLDSIRGLLEYLPAMFGAAAVITIGYVLAKLAQRAVGRVLRRMHLNDVLKRGGIPAHDHTGQPVNPTRVVANLIFWLILFTAMLVAADALGIDYLGQVFSELLSYVPSVIAAVVIVILGIVLGDFVSALITASTQNLDGGPTLARAGKGGVILLATFMALQELGVATDIVTTAFAIIFGALALALSLAFGLGSRDLAGEVTRRWYESWRGERERIARELASEEGAEEAAARSPGTPSAP
ncbi:MAG: mechanosensitive ion channel [Gemmatimonadota bacterium]|nr:mechanosensitive ion channel [Gemmatimonadota bacterium]MDQ8176750.1 mechanosensitive ion channel [Gemmatimonadota bacterium]